METAWGRALQGWGCGWEGASRDTQWAVNLPLPPTFSLWKLCCEPHMGERDPARSRARPRAALSHAGWLRGMGTIGTSKGLLSSHLPVCQHALPIHLGP